MLRMVGVLAVTAWLAGSNAFAQQVTIRWSDVVPATHPSVQMIDRIAANVKEKSHELINIQAFPNGQLGSSRDTIDATANGVQQIVTEGAANFGAWVPAISIVEAPYMWRDAAQLENVMHGPTGEQSSEPLVKGHGTRSRGTTHYASHPT